METDEYQLSKEEQVGYELYDLFADFAKRRVQRETTASARGEEGLLHYLAYRRDGVSSGFLREQLQVGSGRMADILRQLEEKQMIQRETDSCDSRKVIVHITVAGREQAARTNRRILTWYRELTSFLGEKDSKELVRIMRRLNEFRI